MSASEASAELAKRAGQARTWLFEHALPLWWERGFDRETSCFHEKLAPDGSAVRAPLRVRVQARQTVVYAFAGQLGWDGPWRDAVEAGVTVLQRRCLRADGGVRHLLDPRGAPLDNRRDLYDTAFVIFAFAEAGRVLNRPDLIAMAERQVAWIESNWRDAAGGFSQGEVNPAPPRRQNPHMHLFEALLALHDATGDAAHLARGTTLASLFRDKLYDANAGVLTEYFDADWTAMDDAFGRAVEPGHLFEWSWLLHRWNAQGGGDLGAEAERLRAFGEARGVGPGGETYDQVLITGEAQRTTSRLWPNTERLKANLAHFERTGDEAAAHAAAQAFDVVMAFCDTPLKGLWRDVRAAGGGFSEEPAPGSTFYHVMLALSELMRVANRTRP